MTSNEHDSAHRAYSGPRILSFGFRPFFLAAGLWSATMMAAWLVVVTGIAPLPGVVEPVSWHAHEMLFGYTAAVIAGFALTAVPNWTGRLPIRGRPLAVLFALWLAGRIAVASSAVLPPGVVAAIDVAFLTVLASVFGREVAVGLNWRNLPIVVLVTILAVSNAISYVPVLASGVGAGLGHRLALATVITLITLIGGRVVPSFTRNWLVKQGSDHRPAPFGKLDRISIALTAAGLLCWSFLPENIFGAVILLTAAVAGAFRLSRWCGLNTSGEALVWVLHLGYLWVPVGLAFLGVSMIVPSVSASTAVHALTAGAIGTMTLAVMTRATLGHTGRELTAGPATVVIYVGVTLAAVTRLIFGLDLLPDLLLLELSGALWLGSFLLFAAVYGPMLIGIRASGSAGG